MKDASAILSTSKEITATVHNTIANLAKLLEVWFTKAVNFTVKSKKASVYASSISLQCLIKVRIF